MVFIVIIHSLKGILPLLVIFTTLFLIVVSRKYFTPKNPAIKNINENKIVNSENIGLDFKK